MIEAILLIFLGTQLSNLIDGSEKLITQNKQMKDARECSKYHRKFIYRREFGKKVKHHNPKYLRCMELQN